MLRKLFPLMLSALMMGIGAASGFAEPTVENVIPTEPIVVESERLRVTSVYDPERDETLYTAELTGTPDDMPLSAQDLLYTLYVYLDPGCTARTRLSTLAIVGLESYVRQVSQDRLDEARKTLNAIREAGEDYPRDEEDPWSQELQDTYWSLQNAYTAACAAEFPRCAQAIVDYLAPGEGSSGAFGLTAEEIAADEGLKVAYAMLNWGYANDEDGILTGRRSHAAWNLSEGERPAVEDFARELDLAYTGDLKRCWAVESVGEYEPDLPDVEAEFLTAYLGGEQDEVRSVSGIRMVDDRTLEIRLAGVELHEAAALFGQPVLSLNEVGDPALWDPEAGLYGHPFGDVKDAQDHPGVVLLESEEDGMSF